jgi:hypothetical protein
VTLCKTASTRQQECSSSSSSSFIRIHLDDALHSEVVPIHSVLVGVLPCVPQRHLQQMQRQHRRNMGVKSQVTDKKLRGGHCFACALHDWIAVTGFAELQWSCTYCLRERAVTCGSIHHLCYVYILQNDGRALHTQRFAHCAYSYPHPAGNYCHGSHLHIGGHLSSPSSCSCRQGSVTLLTHMHALQVYKFYASEAFSSVRKLEKDEDRSDRA